MLPEEKIEIPDNLQLADLYILLVKQQRSVQPLVDVYNSYISWRKASIVWMGILLAIGGLISTIQTLWGLVSPHLVVK